MKLWLKASAVLATIMTLVSLAIMTMSPGTVVSVVDFAKAWCVFFAAFLVITPFGIWFGNKQEPIHIHDVC